ncbi:uncharacterized protein LOC112143965 [Oryzias melastigma]|uniref:uncharacterized protein LOC112143965 n=1 Tax=Oryzias melastigma TaxID=30732 RepID=UPI000CF7DE6A|nr:uncharacterized protein LOC112143965 [Oryzias melastigma]
MALTSTFVWTDKEVELLLSVVRKYKVNKTQENIDWESCRSKYVDILTQYLEQYPAETSTEFPHEKRELTRAILTTKLEAVSEKYRQAVDSCRRSRHGRVVLHYFEVCEQIWGGSPATTAMTSGIETTELDQSLPTPSPSTSSSSTQEPTENVSDTESDNSAAPAVEERRDLLQAKVRGRRLKRKLPAETLWLNALEEDQRVNKKLLDILETSTRQSNENYAKINNTLNMFATSVAEGFSLLRQVMSAPPAQHYMPYDPRGHIYSHTQAHSIYPDQASHSFNSPSARRAQHNANSSSAQDVPHTSLESSGQFSYTQAHFNDE